MSFITETAQAWTDNVFGDPIIGGLVMLMVFVMYGVHEGWSVEVILIIFVPLIATLSFFILPPYIFAVFLIGMAFIVFLAAKKFFNF